MQERYRRASEVENIFTSTRRSSVNHGTATAAAAAALRGDAAAAADLNHAISGAAAASTTLSRTRTPSPYSLQMSNAGATDKTFTTMRHHSLTRRSVGGVTATAVMSAPAPRATAASAAAMAANAVLTAATALLSAPAVMDANAVALVAELQRGSSTHSMSYGSSKNSNSTGQDSSSNESGSSDSSSSNHMSSSIRLMVALEESGRLACSIQEITEVSSAGVGEGCCKDQSTYHGAAAAVVAGTTGHYTSPFSSVCDLPAGTQSADALGAIEMVRDGLEVVEDREGGSGQKAVEKRAAVASDGSSSSSSSNKLRNATTSAVATAGSIDNVNAGSTVLSRYSGAVPSGSGITTSSSSGIVDTVDGQLSSTKRGATSAKSGFRKVVTGNSTPVVVAKSSSSTPKTLSSTTRVQGFQAAAAADGDEHKVEGVLPRSAAPHVAAPKMQPPTAVVQTAAGRAAAVTAAAAQVKQYTAGKANRSSGLDISAIMAKLEKVAQAKAASEKGASINSAAHPALAGGAAGGDASTQDSGGAAIEGTWSVGTRGLGSLHSDSSMKLWSGRMAAPGKVEDREGGTLRRESSGRLASTGKRPIVVKKEASKPQKLATFKF